MKKLFLILSLMFLSSAVYSQTYVQTTKVAYSTTTGKAVFTRVDTFQVGTSTATGDIYVYLLGTGTVKTVELVTTRIVFPDGTIQVSSPVAGAGAAGNKNRNIVHKAFSFWTNGFSNVASISSQEFEIEGSTKSVFYIKLTDSGDNFATTSGVMDRQWNDVNFTAYVTVVTTGISTGNMWINLIVSTAQFSTGSFVTLESTGTAPAGAWETYTVTISFTVTGTGLRDGVDYVLEIRRNIADACVQDVYIKSIYFDYDVD